DLAGAFGQVMIGFFYWDAYDKFGSLSLLAAKRYLSSQQFGELPAYRQTQTRTPVFAAGGSIFLLKGFKDLLMLFRCNANASILHSERDIGRVGRMHGDVQANIP